ncbi:Uncharacterised protein [Achromobacter sp. 2789STDY5608615]|uniref:hypothetical protein n=1 Tax=Achromobacter sp. 2789STDY5608615 TaxID=1806492 RepID=UPI0006C1EF35|nr:hypothetical protein [Achromobacter sp. 2789STDY5608615]CUJ97878.1 Uncharacterised protein [Achromobacter sp. 2789STDY5608615]
MELSRSQAETKAAIVEYGEQHGFTDDLIQIASDFAYIETSFGSSLRNSKSTASGLFQYTDGTWNDFHSALGVKNDPMNQIAALYDDLATYSSWFNDPASNGNIPDDLSFEEYAYIKHHDGRSTVDFSNAPGRKIYQDSMDALPSEIRNANPGPYPGALAMDADAYIGYEPPEDSAGCIKLGADGNWHIDYNLEPLLDDVERQSIVDRDPTGAFYIYR